MNMPTTHVSMASNWKGAKCRSDVTRKRNGRGKIPSVSVGSGLVMNKSRVVGVWGRVASKVLVFIDGTLKSLASFCHLTKRLMNGC